MLAAVAAWPDRVFGWVYLSPAHLDTSLADLERLQRLAATLVRRLFEGLYRRRENQRSRFTLVAAIDSGIPANYFKEMTRGDA